MSHLSRFALLVLAIASLLLFGSFLGHSISAHCDPSRRGALLKSALKEGGRAEAQLSTGLSVALWKLQWNWETDMFLAGATASFEEEWDDGRQTVLSEASWLVFGGEDAPPMRRLVHARMKLLTSSARRSVLLEYSSIAWGTYEGVWLVENESGCFYAAFVERPGEFPQYPVRYGKFPPDEFERAWSGLDRAGYWGLESDASAVAADAGTSFVCASDGKRHKCVAVYAALVKREPAKGSKWQHEFARRTRGMNDSMVAILEALRRATGHFLIAGETTGYVDWWMDDEKRREWDELTVGKKAKAFVDAALRELREEDERRGKPGAEIE